MNNTEMILVWAIAIEFALVLVFVIFTYFSKFFWDRTNINNTRKMEVLRKELNDALQQGRSLPLSYPSRIDLIIPLFQEMEKNSPINTAWDAVRQEIIKTQLLPATRNFINKKDWLKHYYLSLLLGYYAESQDEDTIIRLVKSKVAIVLINAIRVAIKFGSPASLRAVIERISRERTHMQSMLIVEAYQTPKLLDCCADILNSSKDPYMRKACFVLLNQVGTRKEFFELAEHDLRAAELEVRLNAIRVLAKSDPVKALPILRDFLDNPTWQVREVSLKLLTPMQDESSFEKISQMLRDPVWWVRFRAGLALLEFKQKGEERLRSVSHSATDKYAALEAEYILLRRHLQEKS